MYDRRVRLKRALAAVAGALAMAWPAASADLDQWPARLPAGAYVLESAHSSVIARIRFLGLGRHSVIFSRLDGGVDYEPQRWSTTRVVIRVDPRSLNEPGSPVGRAMLDMLQPSRFQAIVFTSSGLAAENGRIWLVGDLTLHGVTRPARFALTFDGMAPASGDDARLAFRGFGQIRRSEFGMPAMRAMVGDKIDLMFQVAFRRRARLD